MVVANGGGGCCVYANCDTSIIIHVVKNFQPFLTLRIASRRLEHELAPARLSAQTWFLSLSFSFFVFAFQ